MAISLAWHTWKEVLLRQAEGLGVSVPPSLMGGRISPELRLWGQWTHVTKSSKQNRKWEMCDGDRNMLQFFAP